jgi:hypothetical protein
MLVWLHTADHKGGASPVQEAEGAAAAGDRTGILRFPVGEQEATMALRFVHHRRGIVSALPYVLHPRMPSLGWGRQTCAAPCPRRFHGCRCRRQPSLTAHRQLLKMSDGVWQACPQTGARDGQERRSALPVPRLMPPQRSPPPPPAPSPGRPESPREDRGGAAADSPCMPTLPASHPAP